LWSFSIGGKGTLLKLFSFGFYCPCFTLCFAQKLHSNLMRKKTDSTPWHSMTTEQVLNRLNSSAKDGLSSQTAQQNFKEYGPNLITQKKGKPLWLLFLMQFNQPLIYILLASGLITALLNEVVDSVVIFGVVLVNAVIGFWQEMKAVKAIEALSGSVVSEATVIRDGRKQRLASSELVPGDLVLLQSGDKVPADLRLLTVKELQVAEAALTGESVPVSKQCLDLPTDTLLAERSNMAYSSTLVTYGTGSGLVVATGNQTEIGFINEMISNADILKTPLTKQMAAFSLLILYSILFLAGLTFGVGVWRGEPVLDMFMAAVALAVGAIPEGLPAAMTIILSIGVARMAKRNAIIRKLPAVETLGSTTVICSDKTGTLTQNAMTVQKIWAAGSIFELEGIGYESKGDFKIDNQKVDPNHFPALLQVLNCGIHCNDSNLVIKDGKIMVEGDPTEAALIVSAQKAGLKPQDHRLDTIPFESVYQYMATLNGDTIFVKGSTEKILERCHLYMDSEGNTQPIEKHEIEHAVDQFGKSGLRVLAFAQKKTQNHKLSHSDVEEDLVFLGLQAMIDPPRKEAIQAISDCKMASIKVKMITGDHEKTALAISEKIGIYDPNLQDSRYPASLEGKRVAQLSDSELQDLAPWVNVFARVSPEDKLRLVRALQANSQVIAMTGDGVNDAPSLRQANIGIAMGISGTDVAKETADMVLTDDNFASIAAAVEEGRAVYDNLVKFIAWTLPTNFGEGLVILVAVIMGVALPILPVQILWINMTTAILLGLMLSFEPKEKGIMKRKPRKPNQPVLNSILIFRIVFVGILLCLEAFLLFKYALLNGQSEATARTVAVNVFVMGELFYLFNCRSLSKSVFEIPFWSNKPLIFSVLLMIVLQLGFTYLPFMNLAFKSSPIEIADWLAILVSAGAIFFVVEIEKWVNRNKIYEINQNPE
jgi:Ca2+-transporting ATPase